jgi:hypothetical protein
MSNDMTITMPNGDYYIICLADGCVWGYDKDECLLEDDLPQFIFNVRDIVCGYEDVYYD